MLASTSTTALRTAAMWRWEANSSRRLAAICVAVPGDGQEATVSLSIRWRYTIPCFSFGNVRELSIVLFFSLMNSAAVRCGIFVVVVRYSRCVVHVHASLHAAYVFLSKAACALPLHACAGNPHFIPKAACRERP